MPRRRGKDVGRVEGTDRRSTRRAEERKIVPISPARTEGIASGARSFHRWWDWCDALEADLRAIRAERPGAPVDGMVGELLALRSWLIHHIHPNPKEMSK